ncbi:bifunctional folylpolyglutamate synthase/dihydrofolate synthase [Cognataquiflexum rubidum]|uniref:bifunctional folylpolyglutamate synthase/dihydrofolate synthase n=1 Tax=Cognataquiflexum rubidum TaxID=2922273 RepID=UPI001F148F58|nr:folylpolyglutamate synthase/dihydrofolate synthase family protein [Cognataquiflexum rubidum]MCH6233688.1 bifunctional folylpolyglutamate synthase/dihydrofolate synthase [Cognataquiflexum rubidum]
MTYQETLDYLFNALPMFQRIGAAAFKNDLNNTHALCAHLGNPERKLKCIHVAGTNGKGSTSHALCSVLMEAGYKVGLYTSPHLKSFTERIKINGIDIPENEVVEFVEDYKTFLEELKPSFFEMTVGMAFWYFAKEKVDIAVIEVGMGGRLDSTNVVMPEVSVITNISYDHMQFLGDTLPLIAAEKAGIIKLGIPVVISQKQQETFSVFQSKAAEAQSPIYFAEDYIQVKRSGKNSDGKRSFEISDEGNQYTIQIDLHGNYQEKNLAGILQTIKILNTLGWKIEDNQVKKGLSSIVSNTGLKGRWQILGENPLIVCDTGHNEDGIRLIVEQINELAFNQLFMVIGMVNDKDIAKVLSILPKDAWYIFCQATIPRAMDAEELAKKAFEAGLEGEIVRDVNSAIEKAKGLASKQDLIFIGGSTFVVAEINDL